VELVKIHRNAFERALWAGAAASASIAEATWPTLGVIATDKLQRALSDAWRAGEPHRTIAIGRILRGRRKLDEASAGRLDQTLLRLGLFDEALELTARRPAADQQADYARAWALAGTDQLELAAQALAGAPPQEADPLARLIAAETESDGFEDWAGAADVIEGALRLGLNRSAARELAGEIARAGLGLGAEPQETTEALALARAAIRECGPGEAGLLLDAIGPLFDYGPDQADWQGVRDALAGAPDELCEPAVAPAGDEAFALRHLLALICAAGGRTAPAVRRLGRLCAAAGAAWEPLLDLARLLGGETLAQTPLSFAPPAERRRVFDVFPFDDELAALEIKLHEMSDWVDRFVLVEARVSPDGQPKPLHFEQSRGRFSAFADRIEHVVVDDFSAHVDTPTARRIFLRDQAVRGLSGLCAGRDLVLLSEADEVLDGRAALAFERPFGLCEVESFTYFLNLQAASEAGARAGAAAIEARFLAEVGASFAVAGLRAYGRERVAKAGWRFGRIADPDAACRERDAVLAAVRAGGEPEGFRRVPLDDSFPRTVRERRRELARYILED
jgi:hypothetical protein